MPIRSVPNVLAAYDSIGRAVTATRSFCNGELESLANYLLLEGKQVARVEAFPGAGLSCVERKGTLTSFSRAPARNNSCRELRSTYAVNWGLTRGRLRIEKFRSVIVPTLIALNWRSTVVLKKGKVFFQVSTIPPNVRLCHLDRPTSTGTALKEKPPRALRRSRGLTVIRPAHRMSPAWQPAQSYSTKNMLAAPNIAQAIATSIIDFIIGVADSLLSDLSRGLSSQMVALV